jgi:hypothetical protein
MAQPITSTPVKTEAPTRDDTSDAADDNSHIQMTEAKGAKENETVTHARRRRRNAAFRSNIRSKAVSKFQVPKLKQARFNSGNEFRIRPSTAAYRAEPDRRSTAVKEIAFGGRCLRS